MDDSRELEPLVGVIDGGLWARRRRRNRETTLPHVHRTLEETGRVGNFRRAARGSGDHEGRYYNDSDVYKWIEAAADALRGADRPELRDRLEDVVDAVLAAQRPDGYLNTYFQLEAPEQRWTNLRTYHELYCAGHLIEAAVAHRRATGETRLLGAARRLADHVDGVFGPDGAAGYPGHEGIELALVRLADATGESRYLELASYFIDARGPDRFEWELAHPDEVHGEPSDDGWWEPAYAQAHAPVREHDTAEGHAVRATYLYAGAADVAARTDDDELRETVGTVWENMTTRRMYVTGGVGSAHAGERFTEDYDLPDDGYAETCAALGVVRWGQRMLEYTGEVRYADAVERTLYNGFLAGVGADGAAFFYDNPLVSDGDHRREPWYTTACCPTNAPRLLSALDRYVYARDGRGVVLNQFAPGGVETTVDGTGVELRQETDYPWEGTVSLELSTDRPVAFPLSVRVPGWAREATLAVDGDAVASPQPGTYATVEREWEDQAVTLEVPMPVERVLAHPEVAAAAGRVALCRGPLVYCVEECDVGRDPRGLAVPDDAGLAPVRAPDTVDGVTAIEGEAVAPVEGAWQGSLYRPADSLETERVPLRAVPYFAWAHREPGGMAVWLRRRG